MIETLYKVETPLQKVDGGFGYLGSLQYDTDTDKVQCHICGKWFSGLYGPHIKTHNLTAREYKIRHGLSLYTALCSRGTSAKHSQSALLSNNLSKLDRAKGIATYRKRIKKGRYKAADLYRRNSSMYHNMHGTCDQQLVRKYEICCETLGKEIITTLEMRHEDSCAYEAIRQRFGGLAKFRKTFDFPVSPHDTKYKRKYHTEVSLIAAIRFVAKQTGRIPKKYDFRRIKGQAHAETIVNHFGSWRRAMTIALGLDERKVS